MQADGKIKEHRKLPPVIKINLDLLIYGSTDIRKALEQNQLDRSPVWLTFDDFMSIDFGMRPDERFAITNDLFLLLTGVNIAQPRSNQIENSLRNLNLPSSANDEDLATLKSEIPSTVCKSIEQTFGRLWGAPDNLCPESEQDGFSVLTEKNFTQNLKYVIGRDCPFFGKMLYLYFADGYDGAKITLK